MDPNTGEILAMASRPTFDANNYFKFSLLTYGGVAPKVSVYLNETLTRAVDASNSATTFAFTSSSILI